MSQTRRTWLLGAWLLAAAGLAAAQDSRQMFATASALTKLTSAVEATVLFRNPSPTLSDGELLRLATADNPQLLRSFDPFTVRVLRGDQAVVLLVCKPAQGTALLEDASCTAKLDRHHWRDDPAARCEFSLMLPQACPP